MPDEPFLTITIPTYNRAPMLKRCVESALACAELDLEILVSDNASPDQTQEILKQFKDPRLRHWRKPQNVGAEKNILGLWQGARGKWILCISDDDFFLPGALDKLIAVLRQNPGVGVVLSDLQIVDEAGAPTWVYSFCKEHGRFEAGFESLRRMVWAAHVFSRITFQRAWADFGGVERHLESMYPQMYAVGSVLREHPGMYLKDLFIAHTDGNRVFWEYSSDIMVSSRIALIKDLLSQPRWQKARKVLIKQVVREVACQKHRDTWRAGTWLQRQKAFLKTPEVRRSFSYWRRLIYFLLSPNK